MESSHGVLIAFKNCNSAETQQQWVIWETENDRNHIRICQRGDDRREKSVSYNCLIADSSKISSNKYTRLVGSQIFPPTKPNDEARDLLMEYLKDIEPSQEWKMNSTTHQLASVKYPKVCITTRHFDKEPTEMLLLECNGYGYKSPNPQLNQHQRFYFKPALDKNGEQLCHEEFGLTF